MGAFRVRTPPFHWLVLVPPPPSKICAPQAKIVHQNKIEAPVPLERISRPVPPKNKACARYSVSKLPFLEKNTSKRHGKALDFATKTFFWSSPLNLWQKPTSKPQEPVTIL